ncbi:DUF3742 family protein [Pseudomonas gingeri]|uniref:DUF3742 family protein n=1 Tax=Pseudomonas gingeri TaxID=117681 RepID=UPI0015A0C716|nr:DUF3742 family protein [Pseudomonas gingeri]NWA02718.1 DUF3742 family protein [Pseudomonas gingeri]NWA12108.1 DUF3742 family protein [Pseudomonas gingeri]NWA57485.1 DUF3742 family protein [Pseudomonas gingeri]NWA93828.1 DUF3742 family protein [Pseudomonas gingeri]NWB03300.1 DUF3742 family protein [Pseudomonas gingeri]
MAADTKKKGLIYRLGYAYGWLSGCYLRCEEPVIRWVLKKGMPATLTGLLSGLIRLALIGAFLYLAFWVVVAVVVCAVLMEIAICNFDSVLKEEIVTFNADEVFPDPYSPENINDPAFYRDI